MEQEHTGITPPKTEEGRQDANQNSKKKPEENLYKTPKA